ncbi:long-chain fatty acid transport protein 1-like [Ylistrum balloti]|uniref:long-chain fatty acid transport protein 1-like n=1 Tax=Ylistrum balloti TaxID=509963 RepID=UPI002905B1BF|nr:long-chain fatty acid transport protein 1-like [Ylistrum balloti]
MSGSKSTLTIARLVRDVTYIFIDNMVLVKCAAFFGLGAALSYGIGLSCTLTTLLVFGVYLVTGGWRFTWVVINTLPRDLRGLSVLLKTKFIIRDHLRSGTTIAKLFTKSANKYPNKACILFEDEVWTFQEVEAYSNSIANYFYNAGFQKGDVVSIYMDNRPQYFCLWLGLSKIGVISALINYNLRKQQLTHSITTAESRAVIFGREFTDDIKEAVHGIGRLKLYVTGTNSLNDPSITCLDPLLEKSSKFNPPTVPGNFSEKLFLVFTSGTTGLPKAAVITHTRFFYMSFAIQQMYRLSGKDTLYTSLPLYHTAGGILGVGQVVLGGTTLAIRRKFSASKFWEDCVRYNCTAAQYIGEICRYLLAQPHRNFDRQHKVRLMFGNGLRPQIWQEFQDRFGVQQMGEFYGATEGNCNTLNPDNKVGAVGFTTMIAPFLYPITLIRVDEQGEPIRDRNGVCIRAKPGERGELVGKIVKGDALREFDGYINKTATNKKICANVFKKGDLAFLTGDVLIMDQFGYFYFQDRTGDTFRWRGENVSTTEVEAVISNIVKLCDSVVYGVEVPGVEGRAGMVAIEDQNDNLDLRHLQTELQKCLASYARPVFVRLLKTVATTGTFKLKKVELRQEGFDPNKLKDRLFYMNSKSGSYEPITSQVYRDICSGKIRL